ncbi:bifunctional DNA primase/polymerase [Sphaerisporangium dianthi]|uniref:Bifunctional DNA primase/polymerase n=1 Tax=Sphaerisporangium dianthi TaxID=1436120 RepID=A0ABV9CDZ4_9ACTN
MTATPRDPAPKNDLHHQGNTQGDVPSRPAKLSSEEATAAALELVADGFPVFRLKPNGKEPLIKSPHGMDDPLYGVCKGECGEQGHGAHDATYDPEVVKEWWGGNGVDDTVPNIGMALPGFVALDPDGDEGRASLAALKEKYGDLPPTRVHETGSGGLHIIFKDPEGKFRSLNEALGEKLDVKAGEGSYLVAPTSIHPKTRKPYRIQEHRTPAPAPEYLPEAIEKLAVSKSGDTPDGDRTPLVDLLEEGAEQGGRDEWLTKVAGHYAKSFTKFQDFHALLKATNDVRCNPPLTEREVKKIARSVWNREQAKKEQGVKELLDKLAEGTDPAEVIAALEDNAEFEHKYRDKLLNKLADKKAADTLAGRTDESDYHPAIGSLADVMAEVDEMDDPQWLIEGLWPEDAYGVIAAQKKAGKTWSGLDLAVSVSAGGKWLGEFQCKTGPVIYIIGEGGKRNTIRRIRAIARHKGIDPAGLPIQLCTVPVQITKAEHLKLVRDWMTQVKPALVVIDPFYLSQGAANGTNLAEMGETLREIQVVVSNGNAALAILHHFKKGSASGTDQMTGVGLQEWGRVLAVANIYKSEIDAEATMRTRVTLNWEFSGSEIAPHEFSTTREVWSEDPKSLVKPMYYEVSVGGVAGKRTAKDVPRLPGGQQMLYDAIASMEPGKATVKAITAWMDKHRPERKSFKDAKAVGQALVRLRENLPDLLEFDESPGKAIVYTIKSQADESDPE